MLLEDKLAGASLLIFANKQDLAGALPVQRIIEVGMRMLWSEPGYGAGNFPTLQLNSPLLSC